MAKITGMATLRVPYSVEVDMTLTAFENLSESKQNEILDESIDWLNATRSAEVDEIDIWDMEN